MKPDEVIKAIKGLNNIIEYWTHRPEEVITAKLAIEALEKQIPIKPKYFTDMYDHNKPGCPGCPKNEILYAGQKFCSVCGTKIDWGDQS